MHLPGYQVMVDDGTKTQTIWIDTNMQNFLCLYMKMSLTMLHSYITFKYSLIWHGRTLSELFILLAVKEANLTNIGKKSKKKNTM